MHTAVGTIVLFPEDYKYKWNQYSLFSEVFVPFVNQE